MNLHVVVYYGCRILVLSSSGILITAFYSFDGVLVKSPELTKMLQKEVDANENRTKNI